jgi:hypothetical protein
MVALSAALVKAAEEKMKVYANAFKIQTAGPLTTNDVFSELTREGAR